MDRGGFIVVAGDGLDWRATCLTAGLSMWDEVRLYGESGLLELRRPLGQPLGWALTHLGPRGEVVDTLPADPAIGAATRDFLDAVEGRGRAGLFVRGGVALGPADRSGLRVRSARRGLDRLLKEDTDPMRPTNVLFIFSDQHSRRVLGCYGNRAARTPVLDALAARGTRFASAYCQSPICVPSRGSLATGRWAHAVDSWDNATPYVGTEARSWGHRLTAQGHRVTTIGKLHYRKVDDPSGFPDQRVPMHVLEGVGDLYGLLRGDMPVRSQSRTQVLEARAGESEYIRYDRAIAEGPSGGSGRRRPESGSRGASSWGSSRRTSRSSFRMSTGTCTIPTSCRSRSSMRPSTGLDTPSSS